VVGGGVAPTPTVEHAIYDRPDLPFVLPWHRFRIAWPAHSNSFPGSFSKAQPGCHELRVDQQSTTGLRLSPTTPYISRVHLEDMTGLAELGDQPLALWREEAAKHPEGRQWPRSKRSDVDAWPGAGQAFG
jgi:hypothetical protein